MWPISVPLALPYRDHSLQLVPRNPPLVFLLGGPLCLVLCARRRWPAAQEVDRVFGCGAAHTLSPVRGEWPKSGLAYGHRSRLNEDWGDFFGELLIPSRYFSVVSHRSFAYSPL